MKSLEEGVKRRAGVKRFRTGLLKSHCDHGNETRDVPRWGEEEGGGAVLDRLFSHELCKKYSAQCRSSLMLFLLQLGIHDLFSTTAANLHGVARERSLYVSKIVQKAGLEVNEKGTTASASTGKCCNSKHVCLIHFLTAVKPRYSANLTWGPWKSVNRNPL